MSAHLWEWIDQCGEIHATDIWRCSRCGKEVKKMNNQDPAPGSCPGRGAACCVPTTGQDPDPHCLLEEEWAMSEFVGHSSGWGHRSKLGTISRREVNGLRV